MTDRKIDKCQTPGERRAYKRGYNKGYRRAWPDKDEMRRLAVSWRTKVQEGIGGGCGRCTFWMRDPSIKKWGICNQIAVSQASILTEIICAYATQSYGRGEINTHENFACINFMRKD
jgi:hypothetical protein